MRMRTAITILILILGLNLHAQIDFGYNSTIVSKDIKKIIKSFKKAKQVESSHMYYSGIPSEIFPHFEELQIVATKEELIELTKHSNAITRYYAFWGLLNKNTHIDTLFKIVKHHLKDTVVVKRQFGCIGSSVTIGDYMLSSLKYSDDYEMSDKQEHEIDSLLFWGENNLINERNEIFIWLEKSEINYVQLEKIIVSEKNPYVLIPLLKYQKPEDKRFIKDFIEISPIYAFKAASLFPQIELVNDFMEFQKNDPNDYSNQTWIALYEAALKLPQDIALAIFLNVFKNQNDQFIRERHAQFIYWSIKDIDSQFLFPIKIEISSYLSNMTVEYFNDLWNSDSLRTFKFINEKFENESHPYWDEKLINEIVDKVESIKGDSAINFINQGIRKGYSSTYYTLASRAKRYNNQETKSILIYRFNNEIGKNEQDIYYRSKGILNYDNDTVYKGIEDKVFDFMQDKEIGNFAGKNIVDLALLCNRERTVETLLKYIKENQKGSDFLSISVSKLIELNDVSINNSLIEIYSQSNQEYKNSYFGQTYNNILIKNNLK
jgi:hypothetical protein